MDIPAGKPIKEAMGTNTVDFRKLFPALREHQLTGYLAADILTNSGIEEGVLLFNKGEIIAAEYYYVAPGKQVVGEPALKLALNALVSDGCMDIYELGEDELVLAREHNRDAVLKYKPADNELFGMLPESFVEVPPEADKAKGMQAEAIKVAGGVSKDEVLKKYGISHPDERMLDKLLEGLGNGTV